jgi:hypothetical protein
MGSMEQAVAVVSDGPELKRAKKDENDKPHEIFSDSI